MTGIPIKPATKILTGLLKSSCGVPKIMPGSPEEKAYYESGEASLEQGTMTEEEILREMEKLGM
jgi:hypothetical protein